MGPKIIRKRLTRLRLVLIPTNFLVFKSRVGSLCLGQGIILSN
jgi:hypothetical protein